MGADVDDVVGDDSEPYPSLYAVESFVSGSFQPMPALQNTDAALASGAPFLQLLEPALLLPLFAGRAFGGMAGNRDPSLLIP